MHDVEYVGERTPFYNTPAEEGEEAAGSGGEDDGKKKNKEKKLAFPSVRFKWLNRKNQFGIEILLGGLKMIYLKIPKFLKELKRLMKGNLKMSSRNLRRRI